MFKAHMTLQLTFSSMSEEDVASWTEKFDKVLSGNPGEVHLLATLEEFLTMCKMDIKAAELAGVEQETSLVLDGVDQFSVEVNYEFPLFKIEKGLK